MDSSEYGCNENINVKEDDSVESERCWNATHRGDSRRWLMSDGSIKRSDRRLVSTMKATYPYPFQEEREYFGERRAVVMKKLYDEAAEEVIKERNAPPPIEKYCTEYDGNYGSNVSVEKSENEAQVKKELFEKYPLYTSHAMSFWNFEIGKYQRSRASLDGLTASADLKNPFKRYSGFTKPISEVLDDCNL